MLRICLVIALAVAGVCASHDVEVGHHDLYNYGHNHGVQYAQPQYGYSGYYPGSYYGANQYGYGSPAYYGSGSNGVYGGYQSAVVPAASYYSHGVQPSSYSAGNVVSHYAAVPATKSAAHHRYQTVGVPSGVAYHQSAVVPSTAGYRYQTVGVPASVGYQTVGVPASVGYQTVGYPGSVNYQSSAYPVASSGYSFKSVGVADAPTYHSSAAVPISA